MAYEERMGLAEAIRQATPWIQRAFMSPFEEEQLRRQMLRDYLLEQAEAGRIERFIPERPDLSPLTEQELYPELTPSLRAWESPITAIRTPTPPPTVGPLRAFLERPPLPAVQRPLEGTEPFDVYREILRTGELPKGYAIRPTPSEKPLTPWQQAQLELQKAREERLKAQQQTLAAHRKWQQERAVASDKDKTLNDTLQLSSRYLALSKQYELTDPEAAEEYKLEAARLVKEAQDYAERTGAVPRSYLIKTIEEYEPRLWGKERRIERKVIIKKGEQTQPQKQQKFVIEKVE